VTIRIEPPSLLDRILGWIGKRRAVFIPDDRHSGYMMARRESFLSALLRRKGKQPPTGWVYWDDPAETEEKKG
jgi:hypothetical protein